MYSAKPLIFKEDLTAERLSTHLAASKANERGGYLAVDCEMMGLKPARDRLCLIQICDEHKNVSLVQFKADQAPPQHLRELLEHKNVIKVFHYGRTDLAFLKYQFGLTVWPVFCTKIASKLARTYTEKHGLREVAREFLGLDINKNQQSSDWGKASFSPEQLEYAANDVFHLLEIRKVLDDMLVREGRIELAKRCFAALPLIVDLDLLEYDFPFEHHPPGTKSG